MKNDIYTHTFNSLIQFLGSLTLTDIIEFFNLNLQFRNQISGRKIVCGFSTYYLKFERNYDIGTINKELSSHLTNFE